MIRSLVLLALAACTSLGAAAQVTVHYREGQRVDPRDVARILHAAPAMKTRSIRLLDDSAAPQGNEPTVGSLSLPVQFAFDSAEILPAARPQLDAVAEGIKLLPPGQAIYVEGHTDAVGSGEYNLGLSQRRARAVKLYLVQVHGIDSFRLKDSGYGKRRPIDGLEAVAPENRRVEFRGS